MEGMETTPAPFTDEKLVPAVHSLSELVDELHKVFDSEHVNIDYVKALMGAYKSNPRDWQQYAKFDPFRYTRNLVDVGNGKFNLIALCWGEGHGSSIHDHAGAHCFMKILQGELQETTFDWPAHAASPGEQGDSSNASEMEDGNVEPIRRTGELTYTKNEVAYICDSLGLHRVENKSHSDKAISLHLYSPPFETCHTFDEQTGYRREAKVTFWSKFGKRCPFGTGPNECAVAAVAASASSSVDVSQSVLIK